MELVIKGHENVVNNCDPHLWNGFDPKAKHRITLSNMDIMELLDALDAKESAMTDMGEVPDVWFAKLRERLLNTLG